MPTDTSAPSNPLPPDWREDVPEAGHSTAIRLAEADNEISWVVLTTEEEGIGYLAGAWLGGERGALLMQSSGIGNCINKNLPRVLPPRGGSFVKNRFRSALGFAPI